MSVGSAGGWVEPCAFIAAMHSPFEKATIEASSFLSCLCRLSLRPDSLRKLWAAFPSLPVSSMAKKICLFRGWVSTFSYVLRFSASTMDDALSTEPRWQSDRYLAAVGFTDTASRRYVVISVLLMNWRSV